MPTHSTFVDLMRRLSRAGFKESFVRPALLPDWWDETCERDPRLVADLEIRVARFLGSSIQTLREASARLSPPEYPEARLRRVRSVAPHRLLPSLHAAVQIAGAVVRNLRDARATRVPDAEPAQWRSAVTRGIRPLTLEDLLDDLWGRGIPVIPLDNVPQPAFQGIACIAD